MAKTDDWRDSRLGAWVGWLGERADRAWGRDSSALRAAAFSVHFPLGRVRTRHCAASSPWLTFAETAMNCVRTPRAYAETHGDGAAARRGNCVTGLETPE